MLSRHANSRRSEYTEPTVRAALVSGSRIYPVRAFVVPPSPWTSQARNSPRRITAVEKLKSAQRASLVELDALFASLQHRAFRGEL